MGRLIKNEMSKLLKSRKTRIFLLVLILLSVSVNIYYRWKQDNYLNEIEENLTISYNSAQMRINRIMVDLVRFESEDEFDKKMLIDQYGSIEAVEQQRELFLLEQKRNQKESTYVNILLTLHKQLITGSRRLLSEDKEDLVKQILDNNIKRTNNIIEANKEEVVPESALKLRDVTIDDIQRKDLYYNYLADNDFKYNVNPYTNTGIFSVTKLLDNNIILFIFLIFTFISLDLFLSEVDEGSYKVAYTQPYERRKIFFSKIVAMALFLTITLLLILGINFLINTILNGPGDFNEPYIASGNISKISLNNENIEFKIMLISKSILLKVVLFIVVIIFNISFISMLSIFTDSTAKTVGIEIALILLCLLFREFLSPDSIIHAITPFSYIFTEDILIEKYNTNYILGILLNLSLSAILLTIGYKKFANKDYLGSKA